MTRRINGSIFVLMAKQTHFPNEAERRARIDEAIDNSIEPSPDSAQALAKELDEHVSLVARRLGKRFIIRNGRWVMKRREDE